jgi:hypothetical protein
MTVKTLVNICMKRKYGKNNKIEGFMRNSKSVWKRVLFGYFNLFLYFLFMLMLANVKSVLSHGPTVVQGPWRSPYTKKMEHGRFKKKTNFFWDWGTRIHELFGFLTFCPISKKIFFPDSAQKYKVNGKYLIKIREPKYEFLKIGFLYGNIWKTCLFMK